MREVESYPADWANIWAHEIGHALGLGHLPGHAVMNPSEGGMTELQPPDIAAVQAL